MSTRSLSLADKLAARLAPDQDVMEAFDLVRASASPNRFDSPQDFAENLVEGSLLNISVVGSRALSIPNGEYMVWMTDAGHTMLVPTTDKKTDGGVYEHSTDAYEVQTRDLMANWNRIERVIAENGPPQNLQQGGNQDNLQEPQGEPGDAEEGQAGEFRNTIDASTVDRTPLMRAMEASGYTVTSLAQKVGVDPPAISRILRTPDKTQGDDPGGRNPSMGLASQICSVLRIDPTAAFPDIFRQNDRYQPRNQAGNDGSGSHTHGKGGGAWTQGGANVQEEFSLDDSIVLLEANENYRTLCESIATSRRPFEEFWRGVFIPTLLRTTRRDTLSTFTEALMERWGTRVGSMTKQRPRREYLPYGEEIPEPVQPGAGWEEAMGGPNSTPPAPPPEPAFRPSNVTDENLPMAQEQPRHEDPAYVTAAGQRMTAKLLPPIQKAFQKSMATLKQDLQKIQTAAGVDPKLAPHAWKLADQFYKNVVKAGMAWTPKWKGQAPGTAAPYADAYNKAAQAFQATQAPQAPQTQQNQGTYGFADDPHKDVPDAQYSTVSPAPAPTPAPAAPTGRRPSVPNTAGGQWNVGSGAPTMKALGGRR